MKFKTCKFLQCHESAGGKVDKLLRLERTEKKKKKEIMTNETILILNL